MLHAIWCESSVIFKWQQCMGPQKLQANMKAFNRWWLVVVIPTKLTAFIVRS